MIRKIEGPNTSITVKYLIIGLLNTVFGYAILMIIYALVKDAFIASLSAGIVATLWSYTSYWVLLFRKTKYIKGLLRFVGTQSLIIVTSPVIVHTLIEYINLSIWLTGIIAAMYAVLISFFVNLRYVFK